MKLADKRKRLRYKLKQITDLPRLSIHKTNKYLYAQVVDPNTGEVILGQSSKKVKPKKDENVFSVFGEQFGKELKNKKVSQIAFDRSGYIYHGKIKSFADGVRSAGVKF